MPEHGREQARPRYEYCRDRDGRVARRIMLGQYGIALGGELWIPGRAARRLDHSVLDDETFVEITEDAAARAIGTKALRTHASRTPGALAAERRPIPFRRERRPGWR